MTSKTLKYAELKNNKPTLEFEEYIVLSPDKTIKASLKLKAILEPTFCVDLDPWFTIYFDAKVTFEGEKSKKVPNAKIVIEYLTKYNLESLFRDLKSKEKSLEGIFEDFTLEEEDSLIKRATWKAKRNIMYCIFDLERQTNEIPKKAEEFKKEKTFEM